jgi:hypothetical protein
MAMHMVALKITATKLPLPYVTPSSGDYSLSRSMVDFLRTPLRPAADQVYYNNKIDCLLFQTLLFFTVAQLLLFQDS